MFIPVAKVSDSFDCISGYFSSKVIAELAEPLSVLYNKPGTTGRFIISPNLEEQDKDALLEAYASEDSIFEYLVESAEALQNDLVSSTLDMMKYLIQSKQLDIRIVVMKEGMMHAKIWVFDTERGKVAIHGSSNATKSGLMKNFEQLVFTRTWNSESDLTIVDAYQTRFNNFWDKQRNDSYTLELNDKTISEIFASTKTTVQDESFPDLLKKLNSYIADQLKIKRLTIPTWLKYREGDYKHQGEAIDKWIENKCMGVFEIATGGGKTLTSLICASLSLSNAEKAIIVIAVPNKPLIKQWASDVENFCVSPLDTEGVSSSIIRKNINNLFRKQRALKGHDVVIITHAALKNKGIMSIFDKYDGELMLIGDEAHNLGTESFVNDPPECFKYRLALSATPTRQYDEIGTKKLFNYFGDVVYQFTLKDAIGKCLVPYNYFVHQTYLNEEEQDKWNELTDKINNLMWSDSEETKSIVEQLLIRRKAISEGAVDKLEAFKTVLTKEQIKKYLLVFCSAKGPEQLEEINKIIFNMDYTYHQVTGEETGNKMLMQNLVKSYTRGDIDVLTSKKVLDEGFNIPPIQLAYFLASSGVTRTWVQRLGRVLRKSEATGKKHATIHDFVVLPAHYESSCKSLIETELQRMQWFSEHSQNGFEPNGSMKLINNYLEILEKL